MGPYARRAALLAGALVTTLPGCGARTGPATTDGPEPPIARNPPAPMPRPAHDRVLARADGSCVVSYRDDCPDFGPCEPGPEAERIPCPENLTYPDAHLSGGRIITKNPNGTCSAAEEDDCPVGAQCNPPRPSDLECPIRYKAPARDIVREGDHCVEYFHAECDPGDRCNPPPPQRVLCPDGI